MKKALFICLSAMAYFPAFSQQDVFMKLLENKLLCTDDRLVNFLETNGYTRNHHTFHRDFAENGNFYFSEVINEDPCYAIYRTDSKTEYTRIKKQVQDLCGKETTVDKQPMYNCNLQRMYNVQVTFVDYLTRQKVYEIKIFQNEHFRHQEGFLWD